MGALLPADNRRLQASLARLASDHDGEVLAAVGAIKRILSKADLGFTDLAVPVPLPPPEPSWSPEPARGPRRRPGEVDLGKRHQVVARALLGTDYRWSDWARGFLHSMATVARASPAQRAKLTELEQQYRERAR